MPNDEPQETSANKQDTQNAGGPLVIIDDLSTKPTLVEVECQGADYSSASEKTINKKPAPKDDSPKRRIDVAMPLKVRQCDSVPAPPKDEVIPDSASDQTKGATADVTPASEQLPAAPQSPKTSIAEEQERCEKDESMTRKPQEEQGVVEGQEKDEDEEEGDPSLSGYPALATDKLEGEYPDYFSKMHEQHLEVGASTKRALSLSGHLPLTRDHKKVMDFQLFCKVLGPNGQSFQRYANRDDVLKWVEEYGIT